jgi:Uma2 family endonuclease
MDPIRSVSADVPLSFLGYTASMADPARRQATYADVLALPEAITGEIIDGELQAQPRPAGPHAVVATKLAGWLVVSFGDTNDGPGGWVIVFEPELHLGDDILVPDIAGWRAERLPMSERQGTFFTTVPDWACEVLSPRTATRDREVKAPCYARHGVAHLWLVEPIIGHIDAFERRDGWVWLGTWSDAGAHIPPFDAIALDLAALWASVGGPQRA